MENSNAALKTASVKVLQEWGLMLVDDLPGCHTKLFDDDQEFFRSQVEIWGGFEGTVSIVGQKRFLKLLASNVLGMSGDGLADSEAADEDCRDAFKEMGNVLAGNFLTEAYGEHVTFDLFNPHVTTISKGDFEKLATGEVVCIFVADDAPVVVAFNKR